MIFLIFVQNYFDQLYMRITIGSAALSILLDFIWLIVHAEVIFLFIQELVESLRRNSTFYSTDWLPEVFLLFSDMLNAC
jgi:hypothetical protein